MPPIKSKKSGTTWNDENEFYQYQLSKNPELKQYSPQQVFESAQSNPDFEVIQPAAAQPESIGQVGQWSTQPPPSNPYWSDVAKNFLPDMGREFKNLAGGLVNLPILNYKVITGQVSPADVASGIYKDYKDYYGSGNFQENFRQHPARALGDAAAVLSAGAGATAKLSKAGSAVNRAANVAGKAAAIIDPITMPWELTKGALKLTGAHRGLYDRALSHFRNEGNAASLGGIRDTLLEHNIPVNQRGSRMADEAITAYGQGRKEALTNSPVGQQTIPPQDLRTIGSRVKNKLTDTLSDATNSSQSIKAVEDTVTDALSAERQIDGVNIPYGKRSPHPTERVNPNDPTSPALRNETLEGWFQSIQANNKKLSDWYKQQRYGASPDNLFEQRAQYTTIADLDKALREYIDQRIPGFDVTIKGPHGATRSTNFKESGRTMADLIQGKDMINELSNVSLIDKLLGKTAWSTAQGVKLMTDASPYAAALTAKERFINNPDVLSRLALSVKGAPRTKTQKVVRGTHKAARMSMQRTDNQDQNNPQEDSGFKRY